MSIRLTSRLYKPMQGNAFFGNLAKFFIYLEQL